LEKSIPRLFGEIDADSYPELPYFLSFVAVKASIAPGPSSCLKRVLLQGAVSGGIRWVDASLFLVASTGGTLEEMNGSGVFDSFGRVGCG
jgi:hypothetical protein